MTRPAPAHPSRRSARRSTHGTGRHRRRVHHRHAGPAPGQARPGADYFVEEVTAHGAEGCNYLHGRRRRHEHRRRATPCRRWDSGYGDMVMRPDLSTLHRMPWQPGTVGVLCDLLRRGRRARDRLAAPDPQRQQLDRLDRCRDARRSSGTELEFIVFQDTYEEAWLPDTATSRRRTSTTSTTPCSAPPASSRSLRRIRLGMDAARHGRSRAPKGECNLGQHEIAFTLPRGARAPATTTPSTRTARRRSPSQEGMALTFMAKFDQREGNSCTSTCPSAARDGSMVHGRRPPTTTGLSELGRAFIAGQLAHARRADAALRTADQLVQARTCLGPSRRRRSAGAATTAPAPSGWSATRPSLRLEDRRPGGDVNPYLAVAGMVAAGLDGIERKLGLEPAFAGQRLRQPNPTRVRAHERGPAPCGSRPSWVRETFGGAVQDRGYRTWPGSSSRTSAGQ